MKHLPVSLKLTLLVILTTVSNVYGIKVIQAHTLMAQQASRIVPREIPVTTKLLRTSQQALFPQNIRLVVIPPSQSLVLAQTGNGGGSGIIWVVLLGGVGVAAIAAGFISWKGLVVIGENEVGIVYKKFGKSLTSQGKIALNDEAGYQADTLNPGQYWGYWPWIYTIRKEPVIVIEPGEIGLVEAKYGESLKSGRKFGHIVECDDFQNARAFLSPEKGQRGKQLAILQAGIYRINTEVFKIRKQPETCISPEEIGLVVANDGDPIELGRMFGQVVECKNFQDAEAFLSPGKGQMGKQVAILPTGTYQINTDLFSIRKERVINIPPGEIGLVVAKEGASPPPGKMLGKVVECNNFQDAAAFQKNGGQRGKQLAILSAGNYQINTEIFTIITAANSTQHGMKPEDLRVYTVDSEYIGIVTTLDGAPLPSGEIASSCIEGHNKFQDTQKFIDAGGCRGLQEEVLLEGTWNLNPWFVNVEQVPLTNIAAGTVGVIISYIGKISESKADGEQVESQYQLVEKGYKGVWKIPLYPGKHPINTRVMGIEIVPTHEITLEWSTNEEKPKPAFNYDANLNVLEIRSKDGFVLKIKVTQVISITPENAPKMISRVGSPASRILEPMANNNSASNNSIKFNSIRNLVTRVLEPMIGNYFRNSAQDYKALDFHHSRTERQQEAITHIKPALDVYGVKAVGTYINEIDLDDQLEDNLKRLELLDRQGNTYDKEIEVEEKRRKLLMEQLKKDLEVTELENKKLIEGTKAKADSQRILQEAEAAWKRVMNEIDNSALRDKANTEAELKQLLSEVDLNVLVKTIDTLSPELYAKMKSDEFLKDALGKMNVPNTVFNTSGNSSGTSDALQTIFPQLMAAQLFQQGLNQQNLPKQLSNSQLPNLTPVTSIPSADVSGFPPQAIEPRCPIVLLLDTSSSMSGEFIGKLNEGLKSFKQEIAQDSNASRRVEIAVVTFGNSAKLVQDFTPVESFFVPELLASGTPTLGQGIELALTKLESRKAIYKNNSIQHYKPWVFLITCGNPTDDWQYPAQCIRQASANDYLNFFVVGVKGVNTHTLSLISPQSVTPLMLDGLKFKELFQWLANSLKEVTNTKLGDPAKLPLPNEWVSNNGAYRN